MDLPLHVAPLPLQIAKASKIVTNVTLANIYSILFSAFYFLLVFKNLKYYLDKRSLYTMFLVNTLSQLGINFPCSGVSVMETLMSLDLLTLEKAVYSCP